MQRVKNMVYFEVCLCFDSIYFHISCYNSVWFYLFTHFLSLYNRQRLVTSENLYC